MAVLLIAGTAGIVGDAAPAAAAAAADGEIVDIDYATVQGGPTGVYITNADGTVEARDGLPHFGDRPSLQSGESVIGLSVRPSGDGYWLFTTNGRVFAYGAAEFHGDARALVLAAPMISAIATVDGLGYYMVAEDGGIFTFGTAVFYGSIPQILPGVALAAPVIGIVPSPTGRGYLLVASDGGIFTFGDAVFYGSVPGVLPGVALDSAVVAVIAQPTGYLMVAGDGGIFTFGTAQFHGSLGGTGTSGIVGTAVLPDGSGYAMVSRQSVVHNFGSAAGLGSLVFDELAMQNAIVSAGLSRGPLVEESAGLAAVAPQVFGCFTGMPYTTMTPTRWVSFPTRVASEDGWFSVVSFRSETDARTAYAQLKETFASCTASEFVYSENWRSGGGYSVSETGSFRIHARIGSSIVTSQFDDLFEASEQHSVLLDLARPILTGQLIQFVPGSGPGSTFCVGGSSNGETPYLREGPAVSSEVRRTLTAGECVSARLSPPGFLIDGTWWFQVFYSGGVGLFDYDIGWIQSEFLTFLRVTPSCEPNCGY